MSKIEVNTVEPQCGTTLTLGASGDTVSLPSGVTLSGVGTVSWDTTAKTASFTAVSGTGYFVDSSSSAITVTLPASPSAGNIVSISDYNGSADTNSITVARNSSNINGGASDYLITKGNSAVTFVYVDATVGWTSVQTASVTDNQNPFIVATGGTVTCCGDYKIHTFTGPGTFTVTNSGSSTGSNSVSYLVVAGGGGGADARSNNNCGAGGGGAGGFREGKASSDCYSASPLNAPAGIPVSVQAYPITVGSGGVGANGPGPSPFTPVRPTSGSNSIFSTITSTGGGRGGSGDGPGKCGEYCGAAGGSGGGSARTGKSAGAGNTPPVSPSQGFPGGVGIDPSTSRGSGAGGGATAAGQDGQPSSGGAGGAGATTSINGTPTTRAGGGGGGGTNGETSGGSGGSGGGGAGGSHPAGNATSGTTNTGGGGGGMGSTGPAGAGCQNSGNGGSGIVIIRYKYQ